MRHDCVIYLIVGSFPARGLFAARKSLNGLKPKLALRDAKRMNPDLNSMQNDLTHELTQLEASLHKLKLDYEHYFLGQRPTEPLTQRTELARKLLRPGREPIRNTAARFALNVLKDRFQSFSRKWDRTQGEIEAGTYMRHRFKARLRQPQGLAKKPVPTDSKAHLFETYKRASEACGHSTEALSAERFEQALTQHRARLREKFGDTPVEFEVQVDQGKVRLRARPLPR